MQQHPAPFGPDQPVVVRLMGGGATRCLSPTTVTTEHDDVSPPCSSFLPGHLVHPIQARLGLRTPSAAYTLAGVADDHVTVRDAAGASERWRLHDTTVPAAALALEDEPVVHLHSHGLARIGTSLLYPAITGHPGPCTAPVPDSAPGGAGPVRRD